MRNAEVIRQWQILREIETRRIGVTIHELAALVKVTTRTIRRDLQALQEAGFAIYDEGEENETKRWRLDAQPFRSVEETLSVAEVAALYLSRAVLESLSGWPLAGELRSGFGKLERALNPRMREFLSTLPHVISAKSGPRAKPGPSTTLVDITGRLFDAARDRRVAHMRYFSATSNRAKSYVVQPYRLALRRRCLVAWVAVHEFARLPSSASGCRCRRRSGGRVSCRPTCSARRWGCSGAAQPVELSSRRLMAPFIRSQVWHDSQELDELPDGRVRVS